ncbi:putative multitransmembrane protein [Desulfosporosinus acidiphilus SJ4]|uniref:Putative multitransmembrane protein n=1 Tax=Desulfosporosinus acidiphilus (strain DSM 22704 / JCM 16185 / SJ4) TaxID=646529 RepID=I4D421_DESAJ|nr:YibE/F family protein [Desulfosporosinus acidiphilus]AFM40545.1 putative multitransmembrane protein [Desulfosporosinus acidiphilus SJ4]
MTGIPFEINKLKKYIKDYIKYNNYKQHLIITILLIISIVCLCLKFSNENYYDKTIAKITSITTKNSNNEQIKEQQVNAIIMNGAYKGEKIQLQNSSTYSHATDLDLKLNNEVFVKLQVNQDNKITAAVILDLKRDTYLAYVCILFVLLISLIGGVKGLRSLTSAIINAVIIFVVIRLILLGYNIIVIASLACIIFIIGSLLLATGIQKKTFAAILSTMVGTLISMLITYTVITLLHANGIHYEEMEFFNFPPEQIFMAEILIGTLGAIMDIAISISSSLQEIYNKNPLIEKNTLLKSGLEVGQDIMGTMSNTLIFAYISGSIPIILLRLINDVSILDIMNINISLEVVRALTGCIGIVISVPVSIYISVFLLKRNKIGEF